MIDSILGPNRVIAASDFDICCYVNIKSKGNALAQNRRNSLSYTVRTSRQKMSNQRVGYLQVVESRAFGFAQRFGLGCYQPSSKVSLLQKSDILRKFKLYVIETSII